jgi:peptide-methionine (S)-S-oxide reductase
LRDQVGEALDRFFARPYLLWFVAEDPVRNGKLPGDIVEVTRVILDAIRREVPETRPEQLNHPLRLVCWSWIAWDCGSQTTVTSLHGMGTSWCPGIWRECKGSPENDL